MLAGIDLIRTAGQQHERLDRVRPLEGVAPAGASGSLNSTLDDNTQSALQRFARFIHKEKAKPRSKKGIPPSVLKRQLGAYQALLALPESLEQRGQFMNIIY